MPSMQQQLHRVGHAATCKWLNSHLQHLAEIVHSSEGIRAGLR